MYKISLTGTNAFGQTATEVLGNNRDKAATVSGFKFGPDQSVWELAEFLDARKKRFFPRQLVDLPLTWQAARQFTTPILALNFCRSHRKKVPMQGRLDIEISGLFWSIQDACVRIAAMEPFGVRVVIAYEAFGLGDL